MRFFVCVFQLKQTEVKSRFFLWSISVWLSICIILLFEIVVVASVLVNQIFQLIGVANRSIDTYDIWNWILLHDTPDLRRGSILYYIICAISPLPSPYYNSNYHYLICLSGIDSGLYAHAHNHKHTAINWWTYSSPPMAQCLFFGSLNGWPSTHLTHSWTIWILMCTLDTNFVWTEHTPRALCVNRLLSCSFWRIVYFFAKERTGCT